MYGLGYHLLVFVYEKTDDDEARAARLDFKNVIFIDRAFTADFQTTSGIRAIWRGTVTLMTSTPSWRIGIFPSMR